MQEEIWAATVLARCTALAACTEEPGRITRTAYSPALAAAYQLIGEWATAAGLEWHVDAAGNFIATYPACATTDSSPPTLVIGSHLDTVPDGGRYDGALGVLLGLTLLEALAGRALPFAVQLVGFVDEEGVRFNQPFLGSEGYVGSFRREWLALRDQEGTTVAEAMITFGLDPDRVLTHCSVPERPLGYLEFHLEQGPILEQRGLPLGIVTRIVGITRARVHFGGRAAHAGTTPMEARRDALAGAAAFVVALEEQARRTPGAVATVGMLSVEPGASNVIPGAATLSLDIRHQDDEVRRGLVDWAYEQAQAIAEVRGLTMQWQTIREVRATPLDRHLTELLEEAVAAVGLPVLRLASGAGHDAMVLARVMPAAMVFIRTPGGLSHHPDERVEASDITAALQVGLAFVERLAAQTAFRGGTA